MRSEMVPFVKRVAALADKATVEGILDAESAKALVALADEQERERGVLNLGSVIARLGAGVVVLGVILLISANWRDIGDGVKIAGLLALLGGAHGLGLWIRWTDRPYPKTADAMHVAGAGLFLAGVGLIAQIYNLDARPPNAILLWLVAIAPLAVLLRSAPVSGLTVFALWLWLHLEGSFPGSPVQMSGFASFLMLSLGLGAALLGVQTLLGPEDGAVRNTMRALAVILLFYGIYALGFYRHFDAPGRDVSGQRWLLPTVVLLLGAAGMGAGWRRLVPESRWLRSRLVLLMALLLAACAATLAVEWGAIPQGPDLEFFGFGAGNRRYALAGWAISVGAWGIWFFLALWCVAYGTLRRQKDYLNVGVVGFGLGVVTRFFDLVGGLAETGMLFVVGGVVLLVTAWAMEKWRRAMVARMEGAA